MENNDKIRKANEELEILSADEEARELAEYRESSLREMASAKSYGISIGRKEGEEKAKCQMVKSMLKKNIDINDIVEITGLTKEEIEKIDKK